MAVDYGIKVSKPGIDVATSGVTDTLLDTRFPLFKVFMEGEDSIFLPGTLNTKNKIITHNLGYTPAVFVYSEITEGSGIRYLINGRVPFIDPSDEVFVSAYADATDLVVEVFTGSPIGTDKTYDFHYYITYDDIGA